MESIEAKSKKFTVAGVARRVVAWAILLAAAIFILKFVGVLVIGFAKVILTIVVIAAVIGGVLWAMRQLRGNN